MNPNQANTDRNHPNDCQYALRRGVGYWAVAFEGREAIFKHELGAKLSSLKGIIWVGVGVFVFGLASLGWRHGVGAGSFASLYYLYRVSY